MLVSIVIRAFNEERYIGELLTAISNQLLKGHDLEIVIVDSGSTDKTLEISREHGCRITHIEKQEFTFGRSLNIGCKFAAGDLLVFVSGHCIPASEDWLENLIAPLVDNRAGYSYGRQIGRDSTKFSEQSLFTKYFPNYSKIPQEGFYCNNANAAVRKDLWERFKFDESLTGLEDMYFSKALVADGGEVAYIANAPVFHIHDETWYQVKIRYEREAYALQKIIPGVHLTVIDIIRYFFSGVFADMKLAFRKKVFFREFVGILLFRLMQYWGAYLGNHEHRKLSRSAKYRYFYPKDIESHIYEKRENSSPVTDESNQ